MMQGTVLPMHVVRGGLLAQRAAAGSFARSPAHSRGQSMGASLGLSAFTIARGAASRCGVSRVRCSFFVLLRSRLRLRAPVGGPQRHKIHHCGISRNRLTLKSSPIPAVSAVVAADWLRLDGRMET